MQKISKPSLNQIYQAILERDKIDDEIDRKNRKSLTAAGLALKKPKKTIEINSGRIIGVSNVVNLIEKEILPEVKIISIEGKSGCGKSDTAKMLSEKIDAILFSFGEIFRYLTYCRMQNKALNIGRELKTLRCRLIDDKVCLHKSGCNLSVELQKQLRTYQIDVEVAKTASCSQAEVIHFVSEEISRLVKKSDKKIVLEGRAHTLDFLPSDLRIILFADVDVRAERRLKQK